MSREEYAYLLLRLAQYEEAQQLLEESLHIADRELAPSAAPPHAGWGANLFRLA